MPAATNYVQESKIDWSKLVAFTSDGANVMVGKHCGVATRIKTDWPCVLTSHCAAHRLALACADFFKEFPALVKVDNMLSKIYNYAKTSTGALGRASGCCVASCE